MKQSFSKAWNWWKTRTLGHRVILVFLGLLIVGFSVYLDEGPKPSEDGVAQRLERGKDPRPYNYAVDGVHTAVIGSLIVAVLLVPAAGFFGRRLRENFGEKNKVGSGRERLLLGLVVMGSIGILSWYAIPRFGHSLFHDEELSMRRLIVHDHLRVGEDGLADRFAPTIAVRPVSWSETLWWYEQPNNHMGFSVWARFLHNLWPAGDDPEKPYFNPYSLRLAAFIPAVLTLAILAIFLSGIGARIAAFALPPLLALHPWFIKYASEARGYSMTMMLVSCCLLFVWKAASTGRWRWFIGYGIAQFLVLYTNPGTFFFLIVLNVSLYLWLLLSKADWDDRTIILGRFFFCTAVAAMATCIMMKPILAQVRISQMHIAYGIDLFQDMGSSFVAGMRWFMPHDDSLVALNKIVEAYPVLSTAILIAISLLAVLGVWSLISKGGKHAVLAAVVVLPIPLFVTFTYITKSVMYHWYTVNLLPVFWVAVAVGIGFLATAIGGNSERRQWMCGGVLIAALCGAFFWLGQPQRQMQIDLPLEKSLESVHLTRKIIDPMDPRTDEILTVGFHKDTRGNDPALYRVQNGKEMAEMMLRADRENKPLFVNLAHLGFARDHRGDIVQYIENEEYFEEIAVLVAMEPTATRWIFKYRPGSYKSGSGD